ncbi:unnamed protein product [Penicillium glandicola]
MVFRKLLILATVGLAIAETSVVSLYIFDALPKQALVASVMAENAETTTYSINCPTGFDVNHCPYAPGLLFTARPTTIEWALKYPYDSEGTMFCSVGGTTAAVCTYVMPTTGSNSMAAQTTTMKKDEINFIPVTITAGPAATATGSLVTATGALTTASGSTGSQTVDAAASSTSTGGLPRMTADGRVILGGAVAAVMAVAL